MKALNPLFFLLFLLLCGCATNSVEKRKEERHGVYSELTPELRAAVDQGQIKVGMPMDAVYIAWGKPSQVVTRESEKGTNVIWLYHGTQMEEHRYWTYLGYGYRHGYCSSPYLVTEYYPRSYVRAEVVFGNGVVKEWRTLPSPVY